MTLCINVSNVLGTLLLSGSQLSNFNESVLCMSGKSSIALANLFCYNISFSLKTVVTLKGLFHTCIC